MCRYAYQLHLPIYDVVLTAIASTLGSGYIQQTKVWLDQESN